MLTTIGAVLPCHAQTPTAIYSISATEVYAGTTTPVTNPDGLVEPGEGVLFRITLSFAPAVGSPIPTSQGPGAVAGFGGVTMRLHGAGGSQSGNGDWSHLALAPGWGTSTGIVVPGSNGSVLQVISPVQWPANSPGSLSGKVMPENPVENVWQGVWTPHSYSQRQVNWNLTSEVGGPTFGFLWAQYGTDPTTGHPLMTGVTIATGDVQRIPVNVMIIPAPGAAGVLVLAGVYATRRRRAHWRRD